MANYMIASGWWCTNDDARDSNFLKGDDYIRSKHFHKLWCHSLIKFTSPRKVLIVDSASPIKADWEETKLPLQVIELPVNLGHATKLKNGKYCGWTASVLLSLEYFLLSNFDYYVYVEQDALLYGEKIIEHCIVSMEDSSTKCMFGNSFNNIQPLEQSFFLIKKDFAEQFLINLKSLRFSDAQMSPEVKFALSASAFYPIFPKRLFTQSDGFIGKIKRRVISKLLRVSGGYTTIPMGFGRKKPVMFDTERLYFQHGSENEIKEYSQKTAFKK